ncbi:MAG: hypothetical protein JWO19_4272 [Bryobacterales bacterium]|jgi:hypothetical protein|nr:hypothetical protein [Bryobacterales bacterium]
MFHVLAEGDQLFFQLGGACPKIPLAAQSATTFSAFGGTIDFVTVRAVEGDFKVLSKGDLPK